MVRNELGSRGQKIEGLLVEILEGINRGDIIFDRKSYPTSIHYSCEWRASTLFLIDPEEESQVRFRVLHNGGIVDLFTDKIPQRLRDLVLAIRVELSEDTAYIEVYR